MLLLLAPSIISSVEGVLWPVEARNSLALAPVLVARPGLRPRRRAGAFYQTHPCLLADVYAVVLEDQDVLDIVEGCHISCGCQHHQGLRRREACVVQEEGSKHIVARQDLRI
eukprot:6706694-Pyramimonas_sp.AAC.1